MILGLFNDDVRHLTKKYIIIMDNGLDDMGIVSHNLNVKTGKTPRIVGFRIKTGNAYLPIAKYTYVRKLVRLIPLHVQKTECGSYVHSPIRLHGVVLN
jgi:hypothetical protein